MLIVGVTVIGSLKVAVMVTWLLFVIILSEFESESNTVGRVLSIT